MNRVDDPVDARVIANCLVLRIYQNHFEILICRILIDPIRVQHTEIGTTSTNTLLGG